MVLKGLANGVTSSMGQQYNIGEKPTVILYTYYYINHHVGTPKQKQTTVLTIQYF